MTSIHVDDFAKVLEAGARIFDTRTQVRFEQDGLPGSEHLSLEQVQAGELPDVPKDEPIYLICERGQVSELVGLYLEAAGFTAVYNVLGGFTAWRTHNVD